MHRWLDVTAAPRDGRPVILWIDDSEDPPTYPVTVGTWETEGTTGLGYWRVFGAKDGSLIYFDDQIRAWMPLPAPQLRGES